MKYKFAIGTIIEVEANNEEEAMEKAEKVTVDNLELIPLDF